MNPPLHWIPVRTAGLFCCVSVTTAATAAPPVDAVVVIDEILYHHIPAYLSTGTTTDAEEWVEIYNRSDEAVDLTGWKLRGRADFDFPDQTMISAGGYLVVAGRASAFALRYPGVAVAGDCYDLAGNVLRNNGEQLTLLDAGGADIKRFTCCDSSLRPASADGGGASLVLIGSAANPNHKDPLNGCASPPSPGAASGDSLPLPADPLGDANNDGLNDPLAYAAGDPPVVTMVTGMVTSENDAMDGIFYEGSSF